MEERLDVVVDSSSATRGIDAITSAMRRMLGMTSQAQSASTKLFDTMSRSLGSFEKAVLNLRSVLLSFSAVITVFKHLGNELTRFQAFISAMSVSTGGVKEARVEFAFLMQMADKLGISINALSHNYSQMAAAAASSGMSMTQLRDIFESFSIAARVMHLSNQDTRLMFYALTQMVSKGVVSMEELRRQLGEKLPGAMNIAANSLNTTMPELEAAIRKGIVNSALFLPIFAEAVRETFSPGVTNAMRAFDAEINRLSNNLQKMIIIFFDLGVADSFTKIIKELNRILSDKQIAEAFGEALKDMADGLTKFLQTISGDTVRSFISDFTGALKLMARVVTEDVMPVIMKLGEWIGRIAAAWMVLKGITLGAAAGTALAGPGGTLAGGIAGGLAAGTAVYGIHDALSNSQTQVSNQESRALSSGSLGFGLLGAFLETMQARANGGGNVLQNRISTGTIGGLDRTNYDDFATAWETLAADSKRQNVMKGRTLSDVTGGAGFKAEDLEKREEEVIKALIRHGDKKDEYLKAINPFHLSDRDKEKISSDMIKNYIALKQDVDAKIAEYVMNPTSDDEGLTPGRDTRLRNFQESMKLQDQLEQESYTFRLSQLQHFTDQELEVYGGRNALVEAMNQEHQDKMLYIESQKHRATRSMELETLSLTQSFFQAFAQRSKGAALAALAISKALAIAQTISATSAAVMRAYSDLGPIAGSAAAVGIKSLGAIQVGLIAATGLVEAGSIGRGSATGVFNANPNTGLPTSSPNFSDFGASSQTVINITVEGNLVGNDDFVDNTLIPALRDAIDNRDVTIISPNSRQAAELVS